MDQDQLLLSLAPRHLANLRPHRYDGDGLCLPLAEFEEGDASCLRTLYTWIEQLRQRTAPPSGRTTAAQVIDFLQRHPPDAMASLIRDFGRKSHAVKPSELMAKTIHDVRGGALTPLLGRLMLAKRRAPDDETLQAIFFLTRDHAKIMRNALPGLDDAKRQQDRQSHAHSSDLLVEKWHGTALLEASREIRVEVDCPERVTISRCCLEFAAVDRILYNLLNNACRHAATDTIRLVLRPIPDRDGPDLRFVLLNAILPRDREYLRTMPPAALFQEGVSTTGSGHGLAIVTDFVKQAYGLASDEETLERGYVGAAVHDDLFAAWFHWPRVPESSTPTPP